MIDELLKSEMSRGSTISEDAIKHIDLREIDSLVLHSLVSRRGPIDQVSRLMSRTTKKVLVTWGLIVAVLLGGATVSIARNLVPMWVDIDIKNMSCDLNSGRVKLVKEITDAAGASIKYWHGESDGAVGEFITVDKPVGDDVPEVASCEPHTAIPGARIAFGSATNDNGPTRFLVYGWLPSNAALAVIDFDNGMSVRVQPDSTGNVLQLVDMPHMPLAQPIGTRILSADGTLLQTINQAAGN